MSRRLSVLFVFLLALLVHSLAFAAATPVHKWSKGLGGSGDDDITDVVADAAGNVYVTGSFNGTVNLGGANLVSAGNYDGFLAKYDPTGAHVWSLRFGNTAIDYGTSVALEPNGDVILCGSFALSVDVGGGTLTGAGSKDILLARFSPIGVHQWSKALGGSSSDFGTITTDASGNIVLAGQFAGTATFGGSPLVSAGDWDEVLAKYNSAGVHQWSVRYGSTGAEVPNAVVVDGTGNIVVGGWFNGAANLGGSALVSSGVEDGFLARYNASGVHLWSKRFGSTGSDAIYDVARDAGNNIVAAGFFNNTVNFGGSNLVSAGLDDIVFAKYDASGTHLWSLRQGGVDSDYATGIDVGAAGDVLATGWFAGTVNFGTATLTNTGALADMFISRLSAAGVPKWVTQCAGPNDDGGYAIAVSGLNDVFAAGVFQGPQFNVGNTVLPNAGGYDAVLTRWDTRTGEPVITSIQDVGNDQGRKVRIRFEASGADNAYVPDPTTSYVALRRNDAPPAMVTGDKALADGWVEVASIKAFTNTAYLIEAPTIGDNTVALGQYLSVFKIRAASNVPSHFYDSLPDSGASVDNLAPGIPGSFVYASGNLTWDESEDEDFDFFTVYGSNTNSFGSATLVDYSVAPAMNVTGSPYVFYFVTATDFNGNEGKSAVVNSLSGVGGTPSTYVLSVSNYPNPFNPRTTVSYTVPSRGHVSVRVFDAHGVHVATLFDGERNAGAYSVAWEGQTKDAAVAASGVYFARIEHNGTTRTKKMVLLK